MYLLKASFLAHGKALHSHVPPANMGQPAILMQQKRKKRKKK
jgi:hypothetical protein